MMVLFIAGLIFFLSSQKGDPEHRYPMGVAYFLERKFFHVLEYFILTLSFFWAFRGDFSAADALRKAVVFAFIFAFTDEWHQTFVPGRDGMLRDVGVDFIGIMLMALIIINFPQWKKKWLK